MPPSQHASVGRYLPWLVVQGFLFLPMTSAGLASLDYGFFLNALAIAVFAWVAFCLIRNLVRLWSVPTQEVSRWSVVGLGLTGMLFGLLSEGPLVEGTLTDSKFLGACVAVLSASLLALAIRHAVRLHGKDPSEATATRDSVAG